MNHINSINLIMLSMVAMCFQMTNGRFEKRRFNQEDPPILQEVLALRKLITTSKGEFDTIAGQLKTTLIASTDPCARYQYIDEIVSLCKGKACEKDGIPLAAKIAALEKNFNPFSGDKAKPAFCKNPELPKSPEVRCIVPLIDPDFPGAQKFNEQAKERLNQILKSGGNSKLCDNKSVLQQAQELGISDCIGCNGGSSSSNPSSPTPTPTPSSSNSNSSGTSPNNISSGNGDDCIEDTTAANNSPPKTTDGNSTEEDCIEETPTVTQPKTELEEDCIEETPAATKPKTQPKPKKTPPVVSTDGSVNKPPVVSTGGSVNKNSTTPKSGPNSIDSAFGKVNSAFLSTPKFAGFSVILFTLLS